MPHFNLANIPLRGTTGAFILNSGLEKLKVDREAAQGVHGFAAGTYPFLKSVDPVLFTKVFAGAEVALGAALLLPIIPPATAGLGLAAFAGGMLGLYVKTPGMRTGLKPTPDGIPIAKDVWMLGIAGSLIVGGRRAKRAKKDTKSA